MNLFDKLKSNNALPPYLAKAGHFVVDDSIGVSLLTALAFKKKPEPYLLVTSNLYKAQKIYDYLLNFLSKDEVLLFPNDELIRAEALTQSKEFVTNQIYALYKLKDKKPKIVIANVAAVTKYLPSPEKFYNSIFEFGLGNKFDVQKLKRKLVLAGYTQVNKIDQTLQFASRGDILDIFSVNFDRPVRIEFFGDEIESIRYFDLGSQISVEKIDKVTVVPANEFILDETELKYSVEKIHSILEKAQHDLDYSTFENLRNITDTDITNILENSYTPRIYKYYSLLCDKRCSLLDYCRDFTLVLVDYESCFSSAELVCNESREYLREMYEQGKIISHLELFQDLKTIISFSHTKVINTSNFYRDNKEIFFNLKGVPFQASKKSDAINVIHNYLNSEYSICICLNTQEQILFITEALSKDNVSYELTNELDFPKKQKIGISLFNLSRGFDLPDDHIVFLTANELFNEKTNVARFDSRFKSGTILKSFEDLQPGDYVVHEYQGIGQFLELQTLEVDGIHRDYLKIAYFGNEILYVPLGQFQLVRKYLGKEGLKPRLSHLHTKDWENTKKRIKERINDLANRLFNLYVERNKIEGYAFQKDDEFQEQFEKSCPFVLTHDQQKTVDEIKKDMTSSHPMDRLLCGDVGFGKTEVAFRAIFKAILSGKQVAMLCPTTLLARQHYERALERFAGFDVRIAIFSRLISDKKQKEYIKEIAKGNIHLVIGTHRLLSKEIVFKDLGFLVIDEEQRFGVEQKERLKELKSNIDVLTLSATPIPRTLQISMLGVRSFSLINTAPQERMPIQTYVIPYKREIVKELVERELGRGGQVFYLHNEVETIYECANRLQKMMPDVKIGVGHGQMTRNDIEDVMIKFYNGELDLLVCTSIIENGIDIPNANMIIVEKCENYGLSQLYQIKGRVGRSNRIAYAYLMYEENKVLNEKAAKRLQAIQDFTELGSGYKIAQRDLMIRGAGDILGPEQAGFIDSIGLDMYIKLLNEAVKEKIDDSIGEEKGEIETNLSLTIDAFIPKEYACDSDKIELYQEILSASNSDSLARIKIKTKDVFGTLPSEVDLLFVKRNVDLLLKESGIAEVKENPHNLEIFIGEPFINIKGIGNLLFETMIPYISRIKMSYVNHKFKMILIKQKDWLKDLEGILSGIIEIKNQHKVVEIQ